MELTTKIKYYEWLPVAMINQDIDIQELSDKTGISINDLEEITTGVELGSVAQWESINDVLDNDSGQITIDSSATLEELKEEISEYGINKICYIYYKVSGFNIYFIDYLLQDDIDDGVEDDELKSLHKYRTTLNTAYTYFASQDSLF